MTWTVKRGDDDSRQRRPSDPWDARLRRVKTAYDPDNVFNQSLPIAPADDEVMAAHSR